jgi:TM2 domain-containing membrane protein YozV
MDQSEKDRIAAELAADYRRTVRETAQADARARHNTRAMPVAFKSLGVAYLLWFFLGGCGAHRFYLGYAVSGAAMFLATTFCVVFALLPFLSIVSFPIAVALMIWWLIDAFMIPRMMPDSPAF